LFTSNFFHFHHQEDPRLVSIANWDPHWYKGRRYPALAPKKNMLKGLSREEYTRRYSRILAGLDPQRVWNDLGEDAILLCWERPGEFCHRRLVAEWLEQNLGVVIPELSRHNHLNQKTLL